MFNTTVKQSIPLNLSRRARATHARPKGIEHGRKIKYGILNGIKRPDTAYLIHLGIVNW